MLRCSRRPLEKNKRKNLPTCQALWHFAKNHQQKHTPMAASMALTRVKREVMEVRKDKEVRARLAARALFRLAHFPRAD